jgi:TatD DNase family protein
MSSPLIDFHCHLDLYPDFEDKIKETEKAGIYTLAVTTTPRAWKRNLELTENLRFVRPALGLHPQLVGKNTTRELELWEHLLPQAKYVGEVGLDAGPGFFHTIDEQKKVFEHILASCAAIGDKVLSVHAVRSVSTVLDMVEALLPPDRGTIVIHWFTGTQTEARRAAELGCYFSVNMPMLLNERGRTLVCSLPPERILTETDGPFTRYQNRQSFPGDIEQTIEMLGAVLGTPLLAVSKNIADNLQAVVGSL